MKQKNVLADLLLLSLLSTLFFISVFTVPAYGQVHDVVVISVTPSRNVVMMSPFYPIIYIAVTVINNGTVNETFNVNAFQNGNLISTITIFSLTPGNSKIVAIRWNTSALPKGMYNISADAPLPSDATPWNNFLADGMVAKTCAGDLDGNGIVNIVDIVKVAVAFGAIDPYEDINKDGIVYDIDLAIVEQALGSTPGSPNWNPDADLDDDNDVDVPDMIKVASAYGQTASSNWNPVADGNCDHKISIADIVLTVIYFGQSGC